MKDGERAYPLSVSSRKQAAHILVVLLEIGAIVALVLLIYNAFFTPAQRHARELKQNLVKWERQNVSHYRMSLTVGCFCESYFDGTMPLRVEVRSETVVTALDNKGRTVTPGPVMTVIALFRYAYGSIMDPLKSTGVTYDPALGYPVSIGSGPKNPVPDAGDWFTVEDFEILPP
jgi:hypothetical protein